ncbi:unnamed protein product [Kluyveromyces dobzhanskii CBS 2104]|uniref:WGS project CCBQ000000000 data, contig 00099 n=1 Tax=Kluyveromyces dobzhanskii CBS 2104 TaxID=1427455 RepID=A0A0A8L3Z6_9SACH|nr:unnamed protein product [Kluyveromyces dobzhanskii CBS 2104]
MVLDTGHFAELKEKLLNAFVEEKHDTITLITILDLYSEEVNHKGSLDQKIEYLNEVLSLLQQNKDIVYEIGWDLPKILIKFIHWSNSNQTIITPSKLCLTAVMKCFNEVALFGNAKECFFAGCELMADLRMSDESLVKFVIEEKPIMDSDEGDSGEETFTEDESFSDNTDKEEQKTEKIEKGDNVTTPDENLPSLKEGFDFYQRLPQELIMEYRFHTIIELIGSTLKRINTLHPSKFLSEAFEAFAKFNLQNGDDIDDNLFLLRRFFSFIRGYIPPSPPPDVVEQLSAEQLDDINKSEEILQRKLICNMLTSSLSQILKSRTPSILCNYYYSLQHGNSQRIQSEYYEKLADVLSRYYELASSFDIDVSAEFQRLCVEESRRIYHSLPKDAEINSDDEKKEITNLVYQLAYTYEIEKIANVREILLDPAGILILQTLSDGYFVPSAGMKISLDDAIYMHLRFVTPSIFSALFENKTVQELTKTWVLYALTNNSTSDSINSLKSLPSYILTVYLQIELVRSCLLINDDNRRLQFSVITRILCLLPEDFSFKFIRDTLLSCPYQQAKCYALVILKDMMEHKRKLPLISAEDNLVDSMKKLDLKDSPPPLPSRAYIQLNDDRIATLHSVALLAIDDCVTNPETKKLKTLLMYLNFFTAFLSKWDLVLMKEICDKINDKLLTEENLKKNDEPHYALLVNAVSTISSKL